VPEAAAATTPVVAAEDPVFTGVVKVPVAAAITELTVIAAEPLE
jgi:hypothetical protein